MWEVQPKGSTSRQALRAPGRFEMRTTYFCLWRCRLGLACKLDNLVVGGHADKAALRSAGAGGERWDEGRWSWESAPGSN